MEERTAPPKILEVCAVDFSAYYSFRNVLEGLVAEGYDVTLACSPGPYVPLLQEMGIKHIPIQIPRRLRSLDHLRAIWELRGLIRQHRFDLVHTHTPLASIIARVAAWLARAPLVIYTAHGFYFHERMPGWLYRTHVLLERILGRVTDHLITVSQEDHEAAIREGIMPSDRATFVANGVDLNRFDPALPGLVGAAEAVRTELGIPAGAPIVGMVGRVVREKGCFEFVRAAQLVLQRVPQAHFLLIGEPLPSDRERPLEQLQELAAELGIADRIHFLGLRSDVPLLLGLMDLFVLPSYREGMPLVVLEAMAMQLPVVATRIRGSRELVVDGETGFLVEVGDHLALSARITDLLTDLQLAERMGMAGRRRVEERYALTRSTAQVMSLIQKLLKSTASEGEARL